MNPGCNEKSGGEVIHAMLEVNKDACSLIQKPRVDFMLSTCFIMCAAMPQALRLMCESPKAKIYVCLNIYGLKEKYLLFTKSYSQI